MTMEDLAREPNWHFPRPGPPSVALERICEELNDVKIQSGEAMTFCTVEPEFGLNIAQISSANGPP